MLLARVTTLYTEEFFEEPSSVTFLDEKGCRDGVRNARRVRFRGFKWFFSRFHRFRMSEQSRDRSRTEHRFGSGGAVGAHLVHPLWTRRMLRRCTIWETRSRVSYRRAESAPRVWPDAIRQRLIRISLLVISFKSIATSRPQRDNRIHHTAVNFKFRAFSSNRQALPQNTEKHEISC